MIVKVKKILIISGIILVSIVVLALIVRGIFGYVVTKKLKAEVERMKAEGKYIEIKDFEIQCEDRENAALPWKEIEEMFSPNDEEKKLISNTFDKALDREILDQEEKTKISELISKNKQCFERFMEVIKKPHFKYETNWDQPSVSYKIPNALKIIQFMKLYGLDAFFKAEEGRLKDAIDQYFSLLAFSNKLLDEPFLIPYLVNVSVSRLQIELLNRMISSKKLDDDTLFNVLKGLDIGRWQKGFMKGIESERAFFLDCVRRVIKGNGETIEELDFGEYKFRLWLFRPFIKSDLIYAMKIFDEALEMIKMPYYKTSEVRQSLYDKTENLSFYQILTALLVPNFAPAFLKKTTIEAKTLAAKAGIASKIFQNSHGIFPDQLSQLVPDILSEVPTDPFSGQSLIYSKTPSGFIVYSVGSNGNDDGGRETRGITRMVAEKDDDWVWYEKE